MAAATIFMGVTGFLVAAYFHLRRPDLPGRLASVFAWPYRVVVNKFYVDELYDRVIVHPFVVFSDRLLFRVIDVVVIDRMLVHGMARTVRASAFRVLKYAHSGLVPSYVVTMVAGAVLFVGYLVVGWR